MIFTVEIPDEHVSEVSRALIARHYEDAFFRYFEGVRVDLGEGLSTKDKCLGILKWWLRRQVQVQRKLDRAAVEIPLPDEVVV